MADKIEVNLEKLVAKYESSGEKLDLENRLRYAMARSMCCDFNALYNIYREAIHADAERRVGENVAAYDVVIRAKRLCRLLALGAPKIIVDSEANLFAQAMVIHTYCKEMTIVDDVE